MASARPPDPEALGDEPEQVRLAEFEDSHRSPEAELPARDDGDAISRCAPTVLQMIPRMAMRYGRLASNMPVPTIMAVLFATAQAT